MSGICDTPVTIEQIARQVNKTFGTNATIDFYESTQIGVDQGFLSKVVKIHNIVWSDGNPKLPKSVVTKIPQMDNFMKFLGELKDSEQIQKSMMQEDVIRKVVSFFSSHCNSNFEGYSLRRSNL